MDRRPVRASLGRQCQELPNIGDLRRGLGLTTCFWAFNKHRTIGAKSLPQFAIYHSPPLRHNPSTFAILRESLEQILIVLAATHWQFWELDTNSFGKTARRE